MSICVYFICRCCDSSKEGSILRCNILVGSIRRQRETPELKADFSNGGISFDLTGLDKNDGIRCMLEEKTLKRCN